MACNTYEIGGTHMTRFENNPQIRVDAKKGNRTLRNIILDELSTRERFRETTNLTKFKKELSDNGYHINDEEFVEVWKGFQSQGAGIIVLGKGGGSDIFKWDLNLILFAKAARAGLPIPSDIKLNQIRRAKPIPGRKGKKGRPKGSKNKNGETHAQTAVAPKRQYTPQELPLEPVYVPAPTQRPQAVVPSIMLAIPSNIKAHDLQALVDMIESIKNSN